MARTRGSKLDRRGSGPFFFILVAFLVYFLYSLAIAAATVNDCGEDVPKSWVFVPPGWECAYQPR